MTHECNFKLCECRATILILGLANYSTKNKLIVALCDSQFMLKKVLADLPSSMGKGQNFINILV